MNLSFAVFTFCNNVSAIFALGQLLEKLPENDAVHFETGGHVCHNPILRNGVFKYLFKGNHKILSTSQHKN